MEEATDRGDEYLDNRDSGARTPPRRRRGATTWRRSPDKLGLVILRGPIGPLVNEYHNCADDGLADAGGDGSGASVGVGGFGSLSTGQ